MVVMACICRTSSWCWAAGIVRSKASICASEASLRVVNTASPSGVSDSSVVRASRAEVVLRSRLSFSSFFSTRLRQLLSMCMMAMICEALIGWVEALAPRLDAMR